MLSTKKKIDQYHNFLKDKSGDELNQKEINLKEYISNFEEE